MPPPQSFQPHIESPSGDSSLPTTFTSSSNVPSQENIHCRMHRNTGTSLIDVSTALEWQYAVAVLQQLPDSTIFACRAGHRSYRVDGHWSTITRLSSRQLQALVTLEKLSDDQVRAWLKIARSDLNIQNHPYSDSKLSNQRLTANAPARSTSSSSSRARRIKPTNTCGFRNDPLQEIKPVAGCAHANDHLCFICEEPRPIQGCNEFKRHLEEHDTRYYCILKESVRGTEDQLRCNFCNSLNPDPKHLSEHNQCGSKGFSRPKTLVDHLKKHHKVDDYSALVEQGKFTYGKKYLACGFCVSCFDSPHERASHIHDAHYKRLNPMPDWDICKEVLGLLSLNQHWRNFRAKMPHLQDSSFGWDTFRVEQLRSSLEVSQKPAEVLFEETIASLKTPNTFENRSTQTSQHPNTISPPHSFGTQRLNPASPLMVAPTLTSKNLERFHEDQVPSQGTYSSPFQAMDDPGNHRTHYQPLFNSVSSTQQQYPAYEPSATSPSSTSAGLGYNAGTLHSPSFTWHSQSLSPYAAPSPGLQHMTDSDNCPTQFFAGNANRALASHSAPSPFSHNGLTSPLGAVANPLTPVDHSPMVSRPESRADMLQGLDMVNNHNVTQRIAQDQDHTGRRRRPRVRASQQPLPNLPE